MTEAEAVAEATRLTAKKEKGVKYTAQRLCRGWAVEVRRATVYFAFDQFMHEAEWQPCEACGDPMDCGSWRSCEKSRTMCLPSSQEGVDGRAEPR